MLLALVLWATQLRYPPLSYPAIGLLELTILAAMVFLLPVRLFRSLQAAPPSRLHPALLPGCLFLLWVLARWAMVKFSVRGSEEVGTLLWMGCYLIIGYCLTALLQVHLKPGAAAKAAIFFLVALSLAGLTFGIHAIWQYHVSYAESYRELLASIGNRQPDRTELGILYHLKLRRVASVMGDPNALATLAALSLCASFELLTIKKLAFKVLGGVSIFAALAAIYYSGSRGGALDALIIFLIFGGFLLITGRRRTAWLFGAALFVCNTIPSPVIAEPDTPSPWQWRSNTVRERLYYLEVGGRMIKMAPVMGLGPGSVDQYFGRLKSPEARETRFLHNWIAQVWAEYGLIGLLLVFWFLVSMGLRVWQQRALWQPGNRALVAIIAVAVFDALIQITWDHRELMSTLGLASGILLSSTAPSGLPRKNRNETFPALVACVIVGMVYTASESVYLTAKSAKQLASDAILTGDLAEATRQYQRATDWLPWDPAPYAGKASLALQTGNISEARMLMQKALSLQPDSASLNVQTAEIYNALGQEEKADAYLTTALDIYPTNPEYNYLKARQLEVLGQPAKALSYAKKALNLNFEPDNADRYTNLVKQLESKI